MSDLLEFLSGTEPGGEGDRHEPFHGRTKYERFKACLAARRAARDVHHHAKVEGLTAQAVADAHRKDLETQDVNYIKYWFDEGSGQVWCLVEAPMPTPR